jgi:hypothetical protein
MQSLEVSAKLVARALKSMEREAAAVFKAAASELQSRPEYARYGLVIAVDGVRALPPAHPDRNLFLKALIQHIAADGCTQSQKDCMNAARDIFPFASSIKDWNRPLPSFLVEFAERLVRKHPEIDHLKLPPRLTLNLLRITVRRARIGAALVSKKVVVAVNEGVLTIDDLTFAITGNRAKRHVYRIARVNIDKLEVVLTGRSRRKPSTRRSRRVSEPYTLVSDS